MAVILCMYLFMFYKEFNQCAKYPVSIGGSPLPSASVMLKSYTDSIHNIQDFLDASQGNQLGYTHFAHTSPRISLTIRPLTQLHTNYVLQQNPHSTLTSTSHTPTHTHPHTHTPTHTHTHTHTH